MRKDGEKSKENLTPEQDADWITGFGYDFPRESLEPDYWDKKKESEAEK